MIRAKKQRYEDLHKNFSLMLLLLSLVTETITNGSACSLLFLSTTGLFSNCLMFVTIQALPYLGQGGRIPPLWCFFANSSLTENATLLKLCDN